MKQFSSIFSQLLSLFSRADFERAATKHQANRAAKGFDCWTQFVAMLFCQLGRAHSLGGDFFLVKTGRLMEGFPPPEGLSITHKYQVFFELPVALKISRFMFRFRLSEGDRFELIEGGEMRRGGIKKNP